MYLYPMKKTVEERIREFTSRAKKEGRKDVKSSNAIRNGSSLHKIIKTKEQAATFMRLLKSL